MTKRLRVRQIDDDEGRLLVRVIRRSGGSVVTWRQAQMVLLSAQGMTRGDYSQSLDRIRGRAGEPSSPKTKSSYLRMAGAFFRDLQEWEWMPRWPDPAASKRRQN